LFGFVSKEMFYVFSCERILIVEKQLLNNKRGKEVNNAADISSRKQSEGPDRLKKLRSSHRFSVSGSSQEVGAGPSLKLGQKNSDKSALETSPQNTEKIRVSESKRAILQDNKDDQIKVLRTDRRSSERLIEGRENVGSSLNSRLGQLEKLRELAFGHIEFNLSAVERQKIEKVLNFLELREKDQYKLCEKDRYISNDEQVKVYSLCTLALKLGEQGFSDDFVRKAVNQRRNAQSLFDSAIKLGEQGFSDDSFKEAVNQCQDAQRLFDSALKLREQGFSNGFIEHAVNQYWDPQAFFGIVLKLREQGSPVDSIEKALRSNLPTMVRSFGS
jgi:hypothetical protein